jgi:hypothetical protein
VTKRTPAAPLKNLVPPNELQISFVTLRNMRANCVRTLAAWCLGRGYNHSRVSNVSGYPDDVPKPSFGPRLRCEPKRP